jgi:3-dehydroquinate synthase
VTNSRTTLSVDLGERSYPIDIGTGILATAGERLAGLDVRRTVVVSNPLVARHYLAPLRDSLQRAGISSDTVLVPDGESYKSWSTLNDVLTRLLELRAERSTCLVALGGGVVGDLAGFAAAIYQRGMPFVQVPTTLLAQVDSSVGGKTAVNHPLGKNMIGAFHQPRAVLIDLACLDTLPPRELSAGLAEVVKYGAIRDAAFFEWLEANVPALVERRPEALLHAVFESCRIKAEIVGVDERESGERALLNFGHTFGHAIESATGYGTWLHGEAVAAGMVLACRASELACGLPAEHTARVAALLARAGLPTASPGVAFGRWMELMGRDKKVERGAIRFVLLDRIGSARVTDAVTTSMLEAVLVPRGPR